MAAPPVPVIFPVKVTDVLVSVPLVAVSVGGTIGALDMLVDDAPAPAELTALTLKVWVPLERLVNIRFVDVPVDVHVPLL